MLTFEVFLERRKTSSIKNTLVVDAISLDQNGLHRK